MNGVITAKPMIYITSRELPELRDWKVGESYSLIVDVKQTGMRKNNDGTFSADFEISNIESAEKDSMNLESVSEIPNNRDFLKASAKIKEKYVKV